MLALNIFQNFKSIAALGGVSYYQPNGKDLNEMSE